jgi:hypothetical protein
MSGSLAMREPTLRGRSISVGTPAGAPLPT